MPGMLLQQGKVGGCGASGCLHQRNLMKALFAFHVIGAGWVQSLESVLVDSMAPVRLRRKALNLIAGEGTPAGILEVERNGTVLGTKIWSTPMQGRSLGGVHCMRFRLAGEAGGWILQATHTGTLLSLTWA